MRSQRVYWHLQEEEPQALYDVAVIRYNSESEYMYVGGTERRVYYTCVYMCYGFVMCLCKFRNLYIYEHKT